MRSTHPRAAFVLSFMMAAVGCSSQSARPPQNQPNQPITTSAEEALASPMPAAPPPASTSHSGSKHDANPLDVEPSPGPSAINEDPGTTPLREPGPGTPSSDVLTKTEPKLTDGEIASVLVAANQGEIQMADLAARMASSPDVKQFAAMMKTQHTTGLQKTRSIQSKAKLEPKPGDIAAYLENEVTAALRDMRDKTGATFDRAYMSAQVQAHKDVLSVVDHRLTPSANNGDLRTFLGDVRQMVSSHLAKAEEIEGKLRPTATSRLTSR
jgi:putative membrane protein